MPRVDRITPFTDGVCRSVEIVKGEIVKDLTETVPFSSTVTGLQRLYWAEQNGFRADLTICVPYWSPIGRDNPYLEATDFRTGSTAIYRIKKEDEFFGELQPYRRLMLERLLTNFTDKRGDKNG